MKKSILTVVGGIAGLMLMVGLSFADSHMPDIHGFASGAYLWNFNDPIDGTNDARVFDSRHNTLSLDVAEIVFVNDATPESRAGYRLDVAYGFRIPALSTSGGVVGITGGDEIDVQQANVSYLAPVGNGLSLMFGKMITNLGAEVIEGYDGYNWNYSRSLLFGYAIPFTHTGLHATYPINDRVTVKAMLVNGWDVVDDNNKDKTYHLAASITPMEGANLTINWIDGAEQAGNDKLRRRVIDVVASASLGEDLSLMLNYDYGWEMDSSNVDAGGDAIWKGVAAYARYQMNEMCAMNVRWELFGDDDDTRIAATTLGQETDVWEITLTPEYKMGDLVVRPEYRHDKADDNIFTKDDGTAQSSQDTIALNVLYAF
ncbi:MAG: porin [Deltaproteobacteria bacterium]|nr:porin [Deltaproteobacteria bacterium]